MLIILLKISNLLKNRTKIVIIITRINISFVNYVNILGFLKRMKSKNYENNLDQEDKDNVKRKCFYILILTILFINSPNL